MGNKLTQEEAEIRVKESFKGNVVLISEYKSRRNRVTLQCLDCGHVWNTLFQYIAYHDCEHYCPQCKKNEGLYTQCSSCGEEIYRIKSDVETNKSGHFYCSHNCANKHKNILRAEKGIYNYRRRAFAKYPHKCSVCNYDEDIRILEVHHINKNRNNNEIDNLIILCPTCHRKITLGYYDLVDNQLIPVVE